LRCTISYVLTYLLVLVSHRRQIPNGKKPTTLPGKQASKYLKFRIPYTIHLRQRYYCIFPTSVSPSFPFLPSFPIPPHHPPHTHSTPLPLPKTSPPAPVPCILYTPVPTGSLTVLTRVLCLLPSHPTIPIPARSGMRGSAGRAVVTADEASGFCPSVHLSICGERKEEEGEEEEDEGTQCVASK